MAKQQTSKVLTDDDVTTELPVQIPKPDLHVVERGLQNVFGLPSSEIQLKDKQFVTHWCNTGISGDQLGKFLDAGYLKVRPEYLADKDRVAHTVSPEGYVVRGNRGEEVLLYTMHEVYRERQMKKARINAKGMANAKAGAVEAAGKTLGDEAAEFLNRAGQVVGGVRDSYERIEKRDEAE